MNINSIKFTQKGSIKMIAHRGLSGVERENTCPAFVAAGTKSYYGIETDVHVTRDGKFIIHHDDTTERLTGKNYLIRETDFDVLEKLLMTDLDNKTERRDLFMPTLDEYLAICKKYEKIAILELKEEMSEKSVFEIAKAVENTEMLEKTTFISFSKQNLIYLRKAYPNADAQFLSGDISEDTVKFILENHFDADIYHGSITKEFVELMHKNGRVVNAWTVNEIADAEHLAEIGIDMITTNILE